MPRIYVLLEAFFSSRHTVIYPIMAGHLSHDFQMVMSNIGLQMVPFGMIKVHRMESSTIPQIIRI